MEGLSSWGGGSHHSLLAWTHTTLGCILLEWGEPERGRDLLSEGLAAWRAIGSPWGEAMTLYEQGCWLAIRQPERAVEPLGESLRIRGRLGDRLGVAECLESIAQATRRSAAAGGCMELVGLARRMRGELEAPLPERRKRQMRGCLEAVELQLGQTEMRARMSAGAALPEADGIDRALLACGSVVAQ
jgi:hypothetical protein